MHIKEACLSSSAGPNLDPVSEKQAYSSFLLTTRSNLATTGQDQAEDRLELNSRLRQPLIN